MNTYYLYLYLLKYIKLKKRILVLLAMPVFCMSASAQNVQSTPLGSNSNAKFSIEVAKTSNNADFIVYSPGRPLRIDDFAAPGMANTIEQAITASGLAMSYKQYSENGQVVYNITVEPFFQKSKSWFLKSNIDAEVLSHEQKHFDLAAIKAHELADALRKTALTSENYKTLSKQVYTKYMHELDSEERAYDDETHHGNKKGKQNAWDKKVNDKLSAIGSYYNS